LFHKQTGIPNIINLLETQLKKSMDGDGALAPPLFLGYRLSGDVVAGYQEPGYKEGL